MTKVIVQETDEKINLKILCRTFGSDMGFKQYLKWELMEGFQMGE